MATLVLAAVLAGCAPQFTTWQRLMGSDDLLIIRTPPGEPPIVIRKEREFQA